MLFGKEIKRKVALRMHYCRAELDVPPKIALQPEFFFSSPFSLVLLKDFFLKKMCSINSFSTMKYGQNNKKV